MWTIFVHARPLLAQDAPASDPSGWATHLWDPYRPEIYSVLGRTRETGFRFGRFRLHAALGILNTYDSNALFSGVNPQDDYVLQIIPGADLIWRTPRFNVITSYRFNFREDYPEKIQRQKGHVAALEADYQFSRRISLNVMERFEKTSDPADVQIPERLNKKTNEAGAGITYRTPGDDLETSLRYSHVWRRYEAQLAQLSFFNNKVSMTSRVNLSSRFRFLPKSVASLNLEYGQTNFKNDPTVAISNSDSKGMSGTLGLTSQFTRKLSIALDVGLSSLYFDVGPDATNVTGGVAVNFRPTLKSSFTVGYQRNVQISTFTNYVAEHRFSLDASWKFARRMEAYAKNQYAFLAFSGPNVLAIGQTRNDFVIQAITGVSFMFVEWGKARVEYQLDRRNSNAVDPFFGNDSADFLKHRVNLGLDFYY